MGGDLWTGLESLTSQPGAGYGGYNPKRFTGYGFSGEHPNEPVPQPLQNYNKLFGWRDQPGTSVGKKAYTPSPPVRPPK